MISPRLYHIVELYSLSEPYLSCFQINDINYIKFIKFMIMIKYKYKIVQTY